jgi:predicted transcriptional regulator
MTLADLVERMQLEVLAGGGRLDRPVTMVYTGDMLSDVLARAHPGELWITIQVHLNVIPVAVMKELAGILLPNGRRPDAEVLRKAGEEGVPLLSTPLGAYEAACRLYELGLKP